MGAVVGVAGCGKAKDVSTGMLQANKMAQAFVIGPDVLEEVKASVKNMFGDRFEGEINVVHVPLLYLNSVRFLEDGPLYRSTTPSYEVPSAFLSYVDARSGKVFVDPYPDSYLQILIFTEEQPHQYEGEYYLSRDVDGQTYFYALGVNLDRGPELGINTEGVDISSIPADVYPILLLRKKHFGAVSPSPLSGSSPSDMGDAVE